MTRISASNRLYCRELPEIRMKTDEKYIVQTRIEADVTSADESKTCPASRAVQASGGMELPLSN
jgi:hypothetical protein